MSDLQLAVDVTDGVMTVGAIAKSREAVEAMGFALARWMIERSTAVWELDEMRTRIETEGDRDGLAVWRGVWTS